MLTFYYATNTCALASHIALEEAGAAYESRWVDFGAAEQTKPDYLEINPKGRVPSLATERGVLTETPAILAYIAQSHPEAKLVPLGDPFAFAEMQSFMAYLCSTVHVAHAHHPRGYRWADDPAATEPSRAAHWREGRRMACDGLQYVGARPIYCQAPRRTRGIASDLWRRRRFPVRRLDANIVEPPVIRRYVALRVLGDCLARPQIRKIADMHNLRRDRKSAGANSVHDQDKPIHHVPTSR
jgi:hypothetical protein